MNEPNSQKWLEISSEFEKYAKFPNCIGALDGKDSNGSTTTFRFNVL